MVEYSIALIGFMGSGKSSVAKALSHSLRLNVLDTDVLIEEKMKTSISEIFEKYGEEKFREVEKEVVENIKNEKNSIISCGGGVCLNPQNIVNIRENKLVVLLDASDGVILERLKEDSSRPILKSNLNIETIEKIKAQRKESYHKAADLIVDTDNKTVLEIADEIIIRIMKGHSNEN